MKKVCGVKFNVTYNEVSMLNGGNRKEPVCELTKSYHQTEEIIFRELKINSGG
jgi:hypothetical protein